VTRVFRNNLCVLNGSVGFRPTGSKQNRGLTSFCQFVRPATALTAAFENRTVAVATKTFKRCLLLAAFVGAPIAIYAQGVDTIVEVPTTAHGSAIIEIPTAGQNRGDVNPDNVTMAGEYKSTKNVVEEQKPVFWRWYADFGYTSEYNFRGTNLTPDSDGAAYFNAQVTKENFTLGFFGIHQLDDASSPSWSIGEGGGGGISGKTENAGPTTVPYLRFPTTTQTRFNELDIFLSYKFSLGPIDVTIGDIGFFIERRAVTFETDVLPPGFFWIVPATLTRFRTVGPDPTVQDEQFDRAYIRLSTSKIPHITPQITYYQTLLSDGSEPDHGGFVFYKNFPTTFAPGNPFGHTPGTFFPSNPRPFNERNPEDHGGYLEGRINGNFPITKWMDFDPSAIISVSFRDRTEPGGANPYAGHPLTGWNHFQAGAKLPIHLLHLGGSSSTEWAPPDADLYFAPFGNYAYHISNPTAGTDRNEWWGGAEFEITF